MNKLKSPDDVIEYTKVISKKNNWKLNPFISVYTLLINGLNTNFNRYGYFSCPCRTSSNDASTDKDIICPCVYAQADINEYGHCYCALYFAPEYQFSSEFNLKMIPERRPKN